MKYKPRALEALRVFHVNFYRIAIRVDQARVEKSTLNVAQVDVEVILDSFFDRIYRYCGQIDADARRRIPDYFAYGADEGYSALGPVSEPLRLS